MSIYLHWEEREPTLEELIVLPKLNFQHMLTLKHILVSFFFTLKADLVLVKDASLMSGDRCSPRGRLPEWAPLLAQLPAAAWCRQMISRVRTELADPECYQSVVCRNAFSSIRETRGEFNNFSLNLFFNSILQLKCINCKKQELHLMAKNGASINSMFLSDFNTLNIAPPNKFSPGTLIYDLRSALDLLILTWFFCTSP